MKIRNRQECGTEHSVVFNSGPKTNRQLFDNRKYLSTKDAANYLGMTSKALRRRCERGQFNPRKPFGSRGKSYFKISELDYFFETSKKRG